MKDGRITREDIKVYSANLLEHLDRLGVETNEDLPDEHTYAGPSFSIVIDRTKDEFGEDVWRMDYLRPAEKGLVSFLSSNIYIDGSHSDLAITSVDRLEGYNYFSPDRWGNIKQDKRFPNKGIEAVIEELRILSRA